MTGERGAQGDRGDRGDRGPQGDHGHHGVSGDTGDTGVSGDTGDRGKQGVPGDPPGKLPILLAGALLAVVLALTAITFVQVQRLGGFTDDIRVANVIACERNNVLLLALYNNTQTDAQARQEAAQTLPKRSRAVFQGFAKEGFRDLDLLVEASADVAESPGGVVQNCDDAFPSK